MSPRNLQEWLDFYDAGQRGRVNLGLERVREAALVLGLLPLHYPAVIVGGTNGKGSTSSSIAYALELSGHRVGLYTSPHLFQYNERIAINRSPILDQALCEAFEHIHANCSHIFLSYFEVGLLACLLHFQKQHVQVGVFEIGLGGRLDAVNIIDPQVSVITTVHFDHMAFLGNTLEEIAFEKAGIMRRGTPVIYGDLDPPAAIMRQAEALYAPLFRYGQDFNIEEEATERTWSYGTHTISHLPKNAMHASNMATAIMALHCLSPALPCPSSEVICKTFQTLQVPGRYQKIQKNCPWIFDVAHNPQAIQYLMERVQQEPVPGKKIAIFCCMVDKDIPGMMACLAPCFEQIYFVPLTIARAASTAALQQAFNAGHNAYPTTQAQECESVEQAIDRVEQSTTSSDAVFVFGSFYLLEAVLNLLK
jgi:dihydrofolate synthase / folylpolyglutamate synthase